MLSLLAYVFLIIYPQRIYQCGCHITDKQVHGGEGTGN